MNGYVKGFGGTKYMSLLDKIWWTVQSKIWDGVSNNIKKDFKVN